MSDHIVVGKLKALTTFLSEPPVIVETATGLAELNSEDDYAEKAKEWAGDHLFRTRSAGQFRHVRAEDLQG